MFTVQLLGVQANRLYESHRSTPDGVELQFFLFFFVSDIEDEDGGASWLRHVSKVVAEKDGVRLSGRSLSDCPLSAQFVPG